MSPPQWPGPPSRARTPRHALIFVLRGNHRRPDQVRCPCHDPPPPADGGARINVGRRGVTSPGYCSRDFHEQARSSRWSGSRGMAKSRRAAAPEHWPRTSRLSDAAARRINSRCAFLENLHRGRCRWGGARQSAGAGAERGTLSRQGPAHPKGWRRICRKRRHRSDIWRGCVPGPGSLSVRF